MPPTSHQGSRKCKKCGDVSPQPTRAERTISRPIGSNSSNSIILGVLLILLLIAVSLDGLPVPNSSPWNQPAINLVFQSSLSSSSPPDPKNQKPLVWGRDWEAEAQDQRLRHKGKRKVRTHVTVPCPFDYVIDYAGKCRKRTAFSLYRIG